jgi:hypothetical protein
MPVAATLLQDDDERRWRVDWALWGLVALWTLSFVAVGFVLGALAEHELRGGVCSEVTIAPVPPSWLEVAAFELAGHASLAL